jgi:hypothetical protein
VQHRLPRPARLTLLSVKLGAVGAIIAAGLLCAPDTTGAQQPGVTGFSGPAVAGEPTRVDRLLDTHECSVSGFGESEQPVSAIVQSARGRLRFVDFETGWQVFTRHGDAKLVAVCLDEPPTR